MPPWSFDPLQQHPQMQQHTSKAAWLVEQKAVCQANQKIPWPEMALVQLKIS